jgi:aldehyde dehydrogenase (NAD+)
MGPVCSKDQYDKVQHYLRIAEAENAKFLLRGGNAQSGSQGKGYFLHPTILEEVSRSSAVAQEEIFGPVLTVFEFSNEDEAVEIANDTSTGLAADLWTQDLSTAHRMARRIQAGIIWINCSFVVAPWMPYGGYKQSGSGFESGPENIEEFTRIKTVVADLTGSPDTWGES